MQDIQLTEYPDDHKEMPWGDYVGNNFYSANAQIVMDFCAGFQSDQRRLPSIGELRQGTGLIDDEIIQACDDLGLSGWAAYAGVALQITDRRSLLRRRPNAELVPAVQAMMAVFEEMTAKTQQARDPLIFRGACNKAIALLNGADLILGGSCPGSQLMRLRMAINDNLRMQEEPGRYIDIINQFSDRFSEAERRIRNVENGIALNDYQAPKKETQLKRTPTAPKAAKAAAHKRESIVGDLRALVWNKSGGVCWYCGAPTNPFLDLHVDHFIPLSDGGTNDPQNLVPSCQRCNLEKGAMHVEAFRAKRGGCIFWFERGRR